MTNLTSDEIATATERRGRRPASDVLDELRAAIAAVAVVELPALIGTLEGIKAEAFARLIGVRDTDPELEHDTVEDRLITAEEAATMLGVTSRWVRDHQTTLHRVNLPGRLLRFSAKRIAQLVKRRSYG